MRHEELIETVLKLDPAERFALVDEILHSLDKPDAELDRVWIDEAERRLAAYREGRVAPERVMFNQTPSARDV